VQFGGALGLAAVSAAATDPTNTVLNDGGNLPLALTAGFHRAFLIGTGLVLAAALIAFTATNTRAGGRRPWTPKGGRRPHREQRRPPPSATRALPPAQPSSNRGPVTYLQRPAQN
jgi:hypothetical protein